MKKIVLNFKNNPSLILLYLIVLIPVLTMCYFLLSDYSHREEQEIKKNEQMARVLAENLDTYLLNVKTTLASLSALPPIQNKERKKIEAIFESIKLADNQVSLFWMTDDKGNIVAKYPNLWPDKRDSEFLKEVFKAPTVITEPRKGTITGLEVITISNLVKDQNGQIKGVIGASIPLENLRKKLMLKIGNTGFPILVTKTGKFLVHPQREQISKKITIDDPIFKAILKGGEGTLDIVAPFDGKRKFFSYVPLDEAEWVVLVIQPLSEFHEKSLKLFTQNGVIIILVVFIVILAAYYLLLFRKREEEARISQAEKLSVVGELAAGMAHEIRNPLTSIKGFAQLAATNEGSLSPDYLDIIMSEVDRIESIVKETMLLAKPTPIEYKPVDVNQLLNEVSALMQLQTNLKDIDLTFTCQPNMPYILAEPNQLKQVFINLIRNSIDALSEQGGEISIDVKRTSDSIIITTKDNGCGIPKEIIEKLGNPFISTKEHGTGLGLMVTYRIIQNHNGKIKVENTSNHGTTFTIELPITDKNN